MRIRWTNTKRKPQDIDPEAEARRYFRELHHWGARTCAAIAQLHRIPPPQPLAEREWDQLRRVLERGR